MTYVLYGDKGSGAFCVEAALAEAGADYRFETISLEKNEQRSEAYRAINPTGKVPALRLPTGEIVTESAGLLLTIAGRHPDAQLLPPPASAARADAYRWLLFMASEIYPMVEISDYPERFVLPGEAEALREKAKARIRERIQIAANAIAGPWFLASGFSVVDIYAVMFSRWRGSVGREWLENNIPELHMLARRVFERPKIQPVWKKHFPDPA
ncbi:MAG TPA: glutathione S-transferase family protein [Rhizomicrobium sp.]|jgi:GST-like protein